VHVDANGAGPARFAQVRVEIRRRFQHATSVPAAQYIPAVSQQPIQAVVWDFGGVISSPPFRGMDRFEIDMGYPVGSVLELLFGDAAYIEGGNPGGGDPGDGAAPSDPASVTHDWHRLEIGELTLDRYFAGIMERAPAVLGKPIDMGAYHRFSREMPVGIHWPVVHRVRELKRDGVEVALLTNNVKEFGDAWRAMFPVDELFEIVVDSSSVGMRKPDERIYRLTCERIGVAPAAAIFVDDNCDNVAAARAIGMEAVHFREDPWTALADVDAILERRGVRPFR
jgi:epoxide hydrolase-like predicted phosphatase